MYKRQTYFLPKTALRFSVLVEKTTFTPGKYARFSERYLKTPVKDTPTTTYRIVGTKMNTYAVPDSSKQFTATIDKKHSIISVSRDQNGVIMAVNSEPMPVKKVTSFQPSPKPVAIDPAKYMTAEILAADVYKRQVLACLRKDLSPLHQEEDKPIDLFSSLQTSSVEKNYCF